MVSPKRPTARHTVGRLTDTPKAARNSASVAAGRAWINASSCWRYGWSSDARYCVRRLGATWPLSR